MATWQSSKRWAFQSQHQQYHANQSDHYSWNYNTTSDTLEVVEIRAESTCGYSPGRWERAKIVGSLYGQEEGKALYACLRNWVKTYCGEKELERLDREAE